MTQNPIQWFPGHMAKTRRVIRECLPDVDLVLELRDARIPKSSENPEIRKILGDKPKLVVLTKTTLSDPEENKKWVRKLSGGKERAVLVDAVANLGIRDLSVAVCDLMREKLDRYRERGMEGRKLRAMIVGIPNVGKSSLINRLAGSKSAKVENRPGVTLKKQWVPTSVGLDLLDMPGVLWPKFDDPRVGENLAITGAIRDQILDTEELAMILCDRLYACARAQFLSRYKLTEEECAGLDCYDLFELAGRRRGLLMAGGEVNRERCAAMLIEEFRSAKIGRITLEPADLN